jgi:hypothetical protein
MQLALHLPYLEAVTANSRKNVNKLYKRLAVVDFCLATRSALQVKRLFYDEHNPLAKWLAGRADSFTVSIETNCRISTTYARKANVCTILCRKQLINRAKKTGFVPPGSYGMEADKNGVWNWLWYGSENRA